MKQLADLMGKPALDDMPLERPRRERKWLKSAPSDGQLPPTRGFDGYWWETCDRLHVTNLRGEDASTNSPQVVSG